MPIKPGPRELLESWIAALPLERDVELCRPGVGPRQSVRNALARFIVEHRVQKGIEVPVWSVLY